MAISILILLEKQVVMGRKLVGRGGDLSGVMGPERAVKMGKTRPVLGRRQAL
jgi:hypothetical protein